LLSLLSSISSFQSSLSFLGLLGAGKCTAEAIEINDYLKEKSFKQMYSEYTEEISDTVFILSPPGNNPETFRMYEVCSILYRE